jgi:hypothetical protein
MLKHFLGLFFVCCFLADVVGQDIKLHKLKPAKKYTAVYNCRVDELYRVEQSPDSSKETEWVVTHVDLNIQQDVLEKKKKHFQTDYLLTHYYRADSVKKANGNIDTVTNQGKIPLVKLILEHSITGQYLGPTIELNSQMMQQRDCKYFYNRCKALTFNVGYLAGLKGDTLIPRTDTLFHAGFDLVVNRLLKFNYAGTKDTLGINCIELTYTSENAEYNGADNMMKALGLEAMHTGVASLVGRLLVDAKTGRLILFDEFGVSNGTVQMTTPLEKLIWPTDYSYHRKMVLATLTKKPRKKIFGIF